MTSTPGFEGRHVVMRVPVYCAECELLIGYQDILPRNYGIDIGLLGDGVLTNECACDPRPGEAL